MVLTFVKTVPPISPKVMYNHIIDVANALETNPMQAISVPTAHTFRQPNLFTRAPFSGPKRILATENYVFTPLVALIYSP